MAGDDGGSSGVKDARFREVGFDPKFARRPKDRTKLKVDARFNRMFTDEDFTSHAAKVDKYGRKLDKRQRSRGHDLKRLYDVQDDEEEEQPEEKPVAAKGKAAKGKAAKGKAAKGKAAKADEPAKMSRREYLNKLARGEIQAESDSDDSSDDDDSSDGDLEDVEKDVLAAEQENEEDASEGEEVPMGEATKRIAIQNLDWSRLTAQDIFAVLQSFLPGSGTLDKVTVYQSQFGEERMKEEEQFGPRLGPVAPRGGRGGSESGSEDEGSGSEDELIREEEAGEGESFSEQRLRKYELNKLKYYFAVATFDCVETANKVYEECDGVEFVRSSVIFDMRFVPDDVELDRPVRDEATNMSDDYEAPDFVTKAIQSTSVELTWDEDTQERQKLNKWKTSAQDKGKRLIGERELEGFLASGSESEDDEGDSDSEADNVVGEISGPSRKKRLKTLEQRKALREALLGAAANEAQAQDDEDEDEDEDVVMGQGAADEGQDEDEDEDEDEAVPAPSKGGKAGRGKSKKDDPFNDPFFADPEAAPRKGKKRNRTGKDSSEDQGANKKRGAASAADRRKREEAELELLMLEERDRKKGSGLENFDFKRLAMGEKLLKGGTKVKGRGKKREKAREAMEVAKQDTFKVDTTDNRFESLYEDPDFGIDRTNSHYKATRGTVELERELLKRRGERKQSRGVSRPSSGAASDAGTGGDAELESMLAAVKAKSAMAASRPTRTRAKKKKKTKA